MGAVPYIHWVSAPTAAQLIAFGAIWWKNNLDPNYLHLIGIEDADPGNPKSVGGSPFPSAGANLSGASFIYVQKIIALDPAPADQTAVNQYCTVHELAHNFSIQGFTADTYHCSNMAWPVASDVPGPHECIMNEDLSANPQKGFVTYRGSPPRFCVNHLLTGDSTLVGIKTSIRDQQDPLPY